MSIYLVHTKTGRKFEVLEVNKTAGTLKLKGELATFTEVYDKERLRQLGYTMQRLDKA